jgi:hypothetical protein
METIEGCRASVKHQGMAALALLEVIQISRICSFSWQSYL